ncbi:MAG TPA: cation-transporting P-type ATPase [Candidatus Thermoplasmatota archaeon]|nr:cation-transporting P-type ATPase [Candidatus Thermoplasmatota archaeon]
MEPRKPWHALTPEEALSAVASRAEGLSRAEANARLAREGANELAPPKRRGPIARFALQFHNVLIYVLLAAAGVTAFLGHWLDTGVIVGVVVVNAFIGFVQEGKAERALEGIRKLLSLQAVAVRDGVRRTIPARELVPGDVVFLQSGDKVPADLRLLTIKNLRIDEAPLTGESEPVEKSAKPADAGAVVGDRFCMAHSGTLVTFGQATGVVVATGMRTELGRISALLSEVQTVTTPLLRQIAQFARWLTAAILAVAAFTFLVGVGLRNFSPVDMFLATVGLTVAAIPEGLPAILTITLAIGVERMAKQSAIVRRLPAVETLGSVTVICSDKTGTLTRNEMTVQTVAVAGRTLEVTGGGYAPRGGFRAGGSELPAPPAALVELARAGLLCNDAALHAEGDGWRLEGDPTEGALVTLAMKAGLEPESERKRHPRLDVVPFESEHRFMATLNEGPAGSGWIAVKGAPERVLSMCDRERTVDGETPIDRARWTELAADLAQSGQRVLAVAARTAGPKAATLSPHDVESGLTLLGLVGITDPPREEAKAAVARCRQAGIRVKMVTGDHALTARAIGKALGIGDGVRVLTGRDLEAMDDATLAREATEVDVYARASPEHKLRLVQALQGRGHVVAMTGDGVNDSPALRRADIGIAMGVKGTEAAKEAAEMVLADDNFASIARAVEEGRTVYDNIRKALLFILPTNGGQALVVVAAVLFNIGALTAHGFELPITPVQILWVNMVVAVTLALALAFEPTEPDVMRRAPRPPTAPLLPARFALRITFVGALLAATTLFHFLFELDRGASLEAARTVAINTLVAGQAFYLFNSRFIFAPSLSRQAILGNRVVLLAVGALIVLQVAFTHWAPMQTLFETTALDLETWGRVTILGAVVFVAVEIEKAALGRRGAGPSGAQASA